MGTDDEGTGAFLLTEKAERDRTVQPGEEDASQVLYSGAQWQDWMQQAWAKTQNTTSGNLKEGTFSTVRVAEHWHMLPRGTVEHLFPEKF